MYPRDHPVHYHHKLQTMKTIWKKVKFILYLPIGIISSIVFIPFLLLILLAMLIKAAIKHKDVKEVLNKNVKLMISILKRNIWNRQ